MEQAQIVVYTIHGCPHCKSAVQLLRREQLSFQAINIGSNAEMMLELAEQTGSSTVPKVFIGDEFIGGYDQLAELVRSGAIENKLSLGHRYGVLPLRGAARHRR